MKKKFIVFITVLFSIGVFAQGDLDNTTYLTFNWVRPTGFGMLNMKDAHHQDIKSARLSYNGKSFGGSLGVGGIYYINKIAITDGLRFGINAEYFELSANFLTGDYMNFDGDKFYDLNVKMSPKVGIVCSYSPVDIMKMDIFFRWAPMVGVWYNNDENYYSNGDTYNEFAVQYSLSRFSIGFNYRISVFLVGVEYIMGTTNSTYEASGITPADISFKDNAFKIAVGFSFE